MKRLLRGLMVLGLFFGMVGQGNAQPAYTFSALAPVPVRGRDAVALGNVDGQKVRER
jgi:hypothetical protein